MLDQDQAVATLREMGLPLADPGAVITAEPLDDSAETLEAAEAGRWWDSHITPAHEEAAPGSEVAVRPEPVPAAYVAAGDEEPVDGAWLLNLVDAWIGRYCYLSDAARHTMAMWVLAQHFRRKQVLNGKERMVMIWSKFGHLLFIAERPGSGKTTMMKIAGFACAPWFFGVDNNPTAPGLCMSIAQEDATVCIDEAHRLIGQKGTRKADVVTIMCASFERAGNFLNGQGGKANRVPVYAPMMIAAKKDPFLTSAGEEISDVIERSALIMCEKPPPGTRIEPETDDTIAEGAQLAERAAAWAGQQMSDPGRIKTAQALARRAAEEVGLEYRDLDVWLGMLTVAALASPGHLEAALDAARELQLNRPVTREVQPDPLTQEVQPDPLKELEAALMQGGGAFGWGMSGPAPVPDSQPRETMPGRPGPQRTAEEPEKEPEPEHAGATLFDTELVS